MFRFLRLAVLAVLIGAAFGSTASASIISISVNGTLDPTYVRDSDNLFGGGNLGGSSFSLAITYDSVAIVAPFGSMYGASPTGESTMVPVSGVVDASLTINGITQSWDSGSSISGVVVQYSAIYDRFSFNFSDRPDGIAGNFVFDTHTAWAAGDIASPVWVASAMASVTGGQFSFNRDVVNYSSPSPEPSTWVMALVFPALYGARKLRSVFRP